MDDHIETTISVSVTFPTHLNKSSARTIVQVFVHGIPQARIEWESRLPCPTPGDLPDPGIEPTSAFAGRFFTTGATWEGRTVWGHGIYGHSEFSAPFSWEPQTALNYKVYQLRKKFFKSYFLQITVIFFPPRKSQKPES